MDHRTQLPAFDLDAMGPWEFAAYALKVHRVALIDALNRALGPHSPAMAMFQREFIDERMDPSDTIAFAKVCYGLLAAAVAGDPRSR